MTQKEFIQEFKTYPQEVKSVVLEKLKQIYEAETKNSDELSVDERIAIAKELSGCLKPEAGFIPMTKEEEREIIEEYLEEKYS